jgi:hypothetical protein
MNGSETTVRVNDLPTMLRLVLLIAAAGLFGFSMAPATADAGSVETSSENVLPA